MNAKETIKVLKSIKAAGSINLLNSFKVVNNQITFTNLRTSIIIDDSLHFTNGVYDLKKFDKAVSSLKNAVLKPEADYTAIVSGKTSYKLKSVTSVEDYPEVPEAEKIEYRYSFKTEDLKHGLEFTLPFVSRKPERSYLCGVYFEIKDDDTSKVNLVSTDGRRLAYKEAPINNFSLNTGAIKSYIIPEEILKSILVVEKIFGDDVITVRQNENNIFVEFENNRVKIISNVIDGNFPNYNMVIPKNSHIEKIGKLLKYKQISDFCKLTKKFKDGDFAQIVLSKGNKEDVLKDVGRTALHLSGVTVDDELETNIEGQIYESADFAPIAVNPDFLIDTMKVLPQCDMYYNGDPLKPVVFKNDDTAVVVIMPMKKS